MTAKKDLKTRIHERQQKTGESYTAARAHVLRMRAELFAIPVDTGTRAASIGRSDAGVLSVHPEGVRVRILDDRSEWIFHPRNRPELVPGHVATLAVDKRWTWAGQTHGSGRLEDLRIDVARLGLEPLPLSGGHLEDLRVGHEPFRGRDPYTRLWRRLTAAPRGWFEFDPIAWCGPTGRESDEEHDPVGDAIDLEDPDARRAALMATAARDLRCLDAHAHLGGLEFDRRPRRALLHFEVGVRIGELSLPANFDGVLVWGRIYNRPFLRCLHGYGLCLWRLGRDAEALRVFRRILALNPNDNQGIRALWGDLRAGLPWRPDL